MATLFQRPYSPPRTGVSAWRSSVGFGLFVFLFLALFQPFGMGAMPGPVWPVALGFGATCTGTMLLLNGLLPPAIPAFFAEERWTVGRQIVWVLLNVALIGLGNALYMVAMGAAQFSVAHLLRFELYTVAIGFFPVVAVVLMNEARLSRHYQAGSQRVNEGLRHVPVDSAPPPAAPPANAGSGPRPAPVAVSATVTVPSETGREDLTVPLAELLFIRAAGNYLEVHLAQGTTAGRKVLRGSLKRTEEAVATHPRLLRCHKSHLVNLDRVLSVSGNAQGYRLHLGHGLEPVPVSRQLNDRLPGLLTDRP